MNDSSHLLFTSHEQLDVAIQQILELYVPQHGAVPQADSAGGTEDLQAKVAHVLKIYAHARVAIFATEQDQLRSDLLLVSIEQVTQASHRLLEQIGLAHLTNTPLPVFEPQNANDQHDREIATVFADAQVAWTDLQVAVLALAKTLIEGKNLAEAQRILHLLDAPEVLMRSEVQMWLCKTHRLLAEQAVEKRDLSAVVRELTSLSELTSDVAYLEPFIRDILQLVKGCVVREEFLRVQEVLAFLDNPFWPLANEAGQWRCEVYYLASKKGLEKGDWDEVERNLQALTTLNATYQNKKVLQLPKSLIEQGHLQDAQRLLNYLHSIAQSLQADALDLLCQAYYLASFLSFKQKNWLQLGVDLDKLVDINADSANTKTLLEQILLTALQAINQGDFAEVEKVLHLFVDHNWPLASEAHNLLCQAICLQANEALDNKEWATLSIILIDLKKIDSAYNSPPTLSLLTKLLPIAKELVNQGAFSEIFLIFADPMWPKLHSDVKHVLNDASYNAVKQALEKEIWSQIQQELDRLVSISPDYQDGKILYLLESLADKKNLSIIEQILSYNWVKKMSAPLQAKAQNLHLSIKNKIAEIRLEQDCRAVENILKTGNWNSVTHFLTHQLSHQRNKMISSLMSFAIEHELSEQLIRLFLEGERTKVFTDAQRYEILQNKQFKAVVKSELIHLYTKYLSFPLASKDTFFIAFEGENLVFALACQRRILLFDMHTGSLIAKFRAKGTIDDLYLGNSRLKVYAKKWIGLPTKWSLLGIKYYYEANAEWNISRHLRNSRPVLQKKYNSLLDQSKFIDDIILTKIQQPDERTKIEIDPNRGYIVKIKFNIFSVELQVFACKSVVRLQP